ncbi:MAG: helix-turn-helix domain-containing protein [Pseudobdellovibrio sp.]
MGLLHNLIITGPDGVRYLVQKIDDVKIAPAESVIAPQPEIIEKTVLTAVSESSEQSSIGHRIRSLRKTKKWSQDELGQRAGVTQVTISRIECGVTEGPHDATIKELLKVLLE